MRAHKIDDNTTASRSVLVTRPILEATETGQELHKLDLCVHIQPMFEVTYLDFNLDDTIFNLITVTSSNAIRALSMATDNRSYTILTVGNKTMACAIQHGFNNVKSVNGTVDSLVASISTMQSIRILYLRGQNITRDLSVALQRMGHNVSESIVYKTVPTRALSAETADAIRCDRISSVLFYSTKTAKIFHDLIWKANLAEKLKNKTAFCFSEKIARSFDNTLWHNTFYAPEPRQSSMMCIINHYYNNQ